MKRSRNDTISFVKLSDNWLVVYNDVKYASDIQDKELDMLVQFGIEYDYKVVNSGEAKYLRVKNIKYGHSKSFNLERV